MKRPLLAAGILVSLLFGCSGVRNAPSSSPGSDPFTLPNLVYSSPDGEDLFADVHVPAGAAAHPAVLLVHGGAWAYGRRWHMSGIAQRLVEQGYTVVNIGYRLAPAHHFPQALYDCRAAVRWMRANADRFRLDPARIGAFGYSAGGHLVALLALGAGAPDVDSASGDSRIEAAVIGAAPTDLFDLGGSFLTLQIVDRFLGGRGPETADLAAAASPILQVTPDDPPIFLYHGSSDWLVPVRQSREMDRALASAGVPHEYHEGSHGHLGTFFLDDEALVDAIAFLDHWLKGPPIPAGDLAALKIRPKRDDRAAASSAGPPQPPAPSGWLPR